MSDTRDPENGLHVQESVDDVQPLRDGDSTSTARPDEDPAQAEWDRTLLADAGEDVSVDTATGDDPAQIPDDLDEIPREDLVPDELQPESQGEDPAVVELGEEGQGDLAPEDL